jgi:hypothetical protein
VERCLEGSRPPPSNTAPPGQAGWWPVCAGSWSSGCQASLHAANCRAGGVGRSRRSFGYTDEQVIKQASHRCGTAWERGVDHVDHHVEEAGVSIVGRHIVEPPETRMVLENVAWETYVALADQRRGSVPRMTYDDGVLELMSPKREHENIGRLIGRMIETYSEVRDIEIISVASVTVKRSDLSKAYEADESYYVTHAAELLGKRELDFGVDPPPDLVLEVEITISVIRS